jgi:hypothetical protein
VSSQTALPCPYCSTPVELRFSEFHPYQQALFCSSCSRGLGLPALAKAFGLFALLLAFVVQMSILKDFGFWQPGSPRGIAAHAFMFFGVVFSSQLVTTLVCRLLTGRLVGRPDLGFGDRISRAAPSSFSQIILLVAGLNVLFFIGTMVWAMSSGQTVSMLESVEPHVLSYRGMYVRVSPGVHSWVAFHEWATGILTFLSIGVTFLEEIRDRRSETE